MGRASQQPASIEKHELRRVDLIVEKINLENGMARKVLMMEAKKHGATKAEILECEAQGWESAMTCSLFGSHPTGVPVWYQTCIGTRTRLWIYDPASELPVPFLPGVF